MTDYLAPADTVFLAQFENCTLPESEWTHTAHIRVAWVCLQQSPADQALARICEGILRYNTEVLKRRNKYHETVTVAFTRIVAERMLDAETWNSFEKRIDDILNSADPILLRYYSADRLFSDEARLQFVAADLQDLPPLGGS